MTQSKITLLLAVLVAGLAAAVVVQSIVGLNRRHAICEHADATLNVLHDVIELAFTPPAGKTLTAVQVRQITAFESQAFARIDRARC